MPGIHSDLEDEIYDLRQRLVEAESDGAEIALNAERTAIMLRNEIVWLREASRHSVGGYCVECKWRLLIIAEIAGALMGFLWFRHFPLPAADDLTRIFGTSLTLFPAICVLGEWFLNWFEPRYGGMSWKDTELVQLLLKKINKFLAR